MANSKLYEQKVKRMTDVAQGRIPDRVPICAVMETYALVYSGTPLQEAATSIRKNVEGHAKIYNDIYYDASYIPTLTHAWELNWNLGTDVYFISADGFTEQHNEYAPMTPEDYPALTANPTQWIFDEFLPRKFSSYDTPNEEQKKAFLSSIKDVLGYAATNTYANYLYKKQDTPVMAGGACIMPLDFIFDYLRGFRPTVADLRRHKEDVMAAVDALADFSIDLTEISYLFGAMSVGPVLTAKNAARKFATGKPFEYASFPWVLNPCHIPAFISPEQFRDIYFPGYKKVAEHIHSHGGHLVSIIEGEWGSKLELFQELPDNSVTVIVENDDPLFVKKAMPNQSIMAGLPLEVLRDGTRDQCIDAAKRMVDELAPGGHFFFSTGNKVLLSAADGNPENIRAVNEFVHGYGLYY